MCAGACRADKRADEIIFNAPATGDAAAARVRKSDAAGRDDDVTDAEEQQPVKVADDETKDGEKTDNTEHQTSSDEGDDSTDNSHKGKIA